MDCWENLARPINPVELMNRTILFERFSLPMNRTRFSFERFSLTPALSRWERENYRQMVWCDE
jgi:hypothetical protein